jgi:hypothetical protein
VKQLGDAATTRLIYVGFVNREKIVIFLKLSPDVHGAPIAAFLRLPRKPGGHICASPPRHR